MRLEELLLPAYGPFTDLQVDLSGGELGLHVVYGVNEAGKSTALRALRELMLGMPHRTTADFRHPSADLRVGARLALADGTELSFLRRKGRKNTLLDLEGRPLGDERVARVLARVPEHLLTTVFFLGRDDLRRGGQDLLAGRGEVGESLLAAGLGSAGLRDLRQAVRDEADALYKPRGQKPTLNQALGRHRELRRRVGELSLSSRQWDEHRRARARAEKDNARVAGELAALRSEHARLSRVHRALPRIARLLAQREALAALGEVPALEAGFTEARQEAALALGRSDAAATEATEACDRLKAEIESLDVVDTLLEHRATIDQLHQRLGSHRKAADDLGRLAGTRNQLRTDALSLLRELSLDVGLEDARATLPNTAQRARVLDLGDRHASTEDAVARARAEVTRCGEAMRSVREELERVPPTRDVAALRRAVDRARRRGSLQDDVRKRAASLAAKQRTAEVRLAALVGWSGGLGELEAAAVPDEATLARFEAELAEAEAATRRLDGQLEEVATEHADLTRRIEQLRLAGAVPTEEDLLSARGRRDTRWKQIREAWLAGDEELDGAAADDYEDRVVAADDVGDRLRREAGRVEKQAALLARSGEVGERAERLGEARVDAERAVEGVSEAWQEAWRAAGVEPQSPREMRGWLGQRERLVALAEELRGLEADQERLEGLVAQHAGELGGALEGLEEGPAPSGESLDARTDRARAVVDEADAVAKRRDELAGRASDLEQALTGASRDAEDKSKALSAWQQGWEQAVGPLGLSASATPVEARAVLERFAELADKLDREEHQGRRIGAIERNAEGFTQDVAAQCAAVASDLADWEPAAAVEALRARLQTAIRGEERREGLAARLAEERDRLEGSRATSRRMAARLEELCQTARTASVEELPAAEERWAEAQARRRDLEAVERTLLEDGAGATLEEILTEAAGIAGDALPGQMDDLARQIDALEQERSELEQQIGSERTLLAGMDGSAAAAEAVEELEAVLADVRTGAERWLRLTLAEAILHREGERYRREHQGPLLERAGALFRRLTLGSFERLEPDLDAGDEPVLVGVRPSRERVRVEGMSEGSRDQLYLALRLASLERWAGAEEPLPLVADDVLVHFDDARAAAALDVLADFSSVTQVVIFTHHARVRELAEGLNRPDTVFVRSLRSTAGHAD